MVSAPWPDSPSNVATALPQVQFSCQDLFRWYCYMAPLLGRPPSFGYRADHVCVPLVGSAFLLLRNDVVLLPHPLYCHQGRWAHGVKHFSWVLSWAGPFLRKRKVGELGERGWVLISQIHQNAMTDHMQDHAQSEVYGREHLFGCLHMRCHTPSVHDVPKRSCLLCFRLHGLELHRDSKHSNMIAG